MGFKDMRQKAIAANEAKAEAKVEKQGRDENPETVWEYKAHNLLHSFGPTLEGDFNKLGAAGWEFQAVVGEGKQGYAIFKRRA